MTRAFLRLTCSTLAILLTLSLAPAQVGSRLTKEVEKQIQILKTSQNAEQRVAAINELLEIANVKVSYAQPAVPVVIAALKDPDVNVRRLAAAAITELGPDPAKVTPALMPLLAETEDRTVRIAAVNSLANLGYFSEAALPAIVDIQQKEAAKAEGARDNDLFNAVNQAVQGINQSILDELNYYVTTLKEDPKVETRLACVTELVRLSKKPNRTGPAHAALANAWLRDANLDVGKTIVQHLKDKEIDPKLLAGTFAQVLANDQEGREVRIAAAILLGTLRADAKDALPVLNDVKAKEEAKGDGKDQELHRSVDQAVRSINLAAPPKINVKTANP